MFAATAKIFDTKRMSTRTKKFLFSRLFRCTATAKAYLQPSFEAYLQIARQKSVFDKLIR